MAEVKDEVVTKCVKCEAELLVGQKFCTECGTKQDIPMKTREEVHAMRESIFKLKPPEAENMLGNLVVMMSTDMAMSWVLGLTTDEQLLDLVSGKNRNKGGE